MKTIYRRSKRGKIMVHSCPTVLDSADVPFRAVQLVGDILKKCPAFAGKPTIPEMASQIRKNGQEISFRYGVSFQACAPARVEKSRDPRKATSDEQRIGMLWFFLKIGQRKVVQFVGTPAMCQQRIQQGR